MQKTALWNCYGITRQFPAQMLRIMRLLTIFLFAVCFSAAARSGAQTVTLSGKRLPLEKVFAAIEKQTGYVVFFSLGQLVGTKPVTLDVRDLPLQQLLEQVLTEQPITARIDDKTIFLSRKPDNVASAKTEGNLSIVPPGEIKGKITDEKGQAISGASITLVGTNIGTASGPNGEFVLSNVPVGTYKARISFIGYAAVERTVKIDGGAENLQIALKPAENTMDETVVLGYGTAKRKDFTGSVSTVTGDDLNKMNSTTFDVAMVGRATGVQVVRSSGAPGAIASVRVRGGTSALGTNDPLYVIDGIPVELGNGFGNAAYDATNTQIISPLSAINPLDIESISILKDASSAAIYGSRAANGVVIVTTKKGKKGSKPKLSISYNAMADNFIRELPVLNADQYHAVITTAYQNATPNPLPVPANFNPYPGASTDWGSQTTRTSVSHNIYMNVNGGSTDGNSLYSLSAGITEQQGVLKATDFSRYNLRTNLETRVFDRLKIGSNMNFSMMENNGLTTSFYSSIITYRPDIPIYTAQGRFGAAPDSVTANPLARLSYRSQVKTLSVQAVTYAELEIIKGLALRSSISYTLNKSTSERYTPSTDPLEVKNGRRGTRIDNINNSTARIFENTLTYIHKYGNHAINVVGGASYTQTKGDGTSLNSINFQDDRVLTNLGSAGSIQTYSSNGSISGLSSYFLRTDYNFRSKYYATFTGRSDHSTKFGPNYRQGFFPSGALSWNLSSEEFMKGIRWIDLLKLRVSLGKTGLANFADFQYATFFGSGSFYNTGNGVIANNIPNPDIRWESVHQLDIATDFDLMNGRVHGSFGYYEKKTVGMIINKDIVRETGGTNQYANIGDFLNKGFELQLGGNVINRKNFKWSTELNLTTYESRVLRLNGGSYSSLKEGKSMNFFQGYKVGGIFQTQAEINALNGKSSTGIYQAVNTRPGDFRFVDVDNNGYIGTGDITELGKAEPDFFGGWNNTVIYKNFELSAFFNFSVGNSVNNIGERNLVFFTTNLQNYSTKLLDAWSPTNTDASLPRVVPNDPNNNRRDSDYFIEKASYFKLKNIQLSYTFRQRALGKAFINNMKAFATVTNVFTITGYSGIDPEVNYSATNNFAQGLDNNVYPQTRTITAGLTVNF